MPRVKRAPIRRKPKRMATGRRVLRRLGYRLPRVPGRVRRTAPINTATVKECVSIRPEDGSSIYFRNWQLADLSFDRAQQVAKAYQEFRIKYIKFTFQPSADTFPVVAGNAIPQLYFMVDKLNSLPTNMLESDFKDMGCRPHRFDARNVVVAFKPSVLVADYTGSNVVTASQMRISPWLSTNANSGTGASPVWAPSEVDHTGLVAFVTRTNPASTIPVPFKLDIELVFEFRKPLWKVAVGGTSFEYNGNGELVELIPPPPPSV